MSKKFTDETPDFANITNKLEELDKKIEGSENRVLGYFITIFGLFTSVFSFLMIEFQFLKNIENPLIIIGFSLMLASFIFGFNISLSYIVKDSFKNNLMQPPNWVIYLFVTGLVVVLLGGSIFNQNFKPKNQSSQINISLGSSR